ncbi:hypothetical protein EWM64_g7771 [Hericium alpestre]|uniref:Uncharacterized protein n=1 Tax=Hericium alpestre TaxID=135208 RepID=A0A4Y9ZQY2_9AGAM|nr:hypothetical protein EWM64_g7771 [Hericium alpestre]
MVAQATTRPQIKLQGLGLDLVNIASGSSSAVTTPDSEGGIVNGLANGHAALAAGGEEATGSAVEEAEEEEVSTPRIDKGKGRAAPEPEVPERVLSPHFVLESDEEGEHEPEVADERSPTDRSRRWVAEEGEVFRKGTKLLTPEEMEGEYAGEDLRIELLEAMVERPPPRAILDDFGMEQPSAERTEPVTSPKPDEQTKPPPRPYVRRTSSASIMSPTVKVASPVPTLPPTKDNGTPSSPNSAVSPSSPSPVSPGPKAYISRRKSSNGSLDAR